MHNHSVCTQMPLVAQQPTASILCWLINDQETETARNEDHSSSACHTVGFTAGACAQMWHNLYKKYVIMNHHLHSKWLNTFFNKYVNKFLHLSDHATMSILVIQEQLM